MNRERIDSAFNLAGEHGGDPNGGSEIVLLLALSLTAVDMSCDPALTLAYTRGAQAPMLSSQMKDGT